MIIMLATYGDDYLDDQVERRDLLTQQMLLVKYRPLCIKRSIYLATSDTRVKFECTCR